MTASWTIGVIPIDLFHCFLSYHHSNTSVIFITRVQCFLRATWMFHPLLQKRGEMPYVHERSVLIDSTHTISRHSLFKAYLRDSGCQRPVAIRVRANLWIPCTTYTHASSCDYDRLWPVWLSFRNYIAKTLFVKTLSCQGVQPLDGQY